VVVLPSYGLWTGAFCSSCTTVTRSPEPCKFEQVPPRAGEERVWVGEITECTSLPLAKVSNLAAFAQILGTLNNTFKPTAVHKFSTVKYTMHWLFSFFNMEAKFGPLGKWIKKRLTSFKTKFCIRTAGCTLFDHKRNEEILEELKVEPAEEELRNTNQIGYNM
jgi:hypothetical protein